MFNSKTGATKLGLLGATALLFAACGGSGGSSSASSAPLTYKYERKPAIGTVTLDEAAKTVKVVADGKTYEGHFTGLFVNGVPQLNQPTVINGSNYYTFFYKGKGDYLVFGGDSSGSQFFGQSGTKISPASLSGTKNFEGSFSAVVRHSDSLVGNTWGRLSLIANMDASTVKSVPRTSSADDTFRSEFIVDATVQGDTVKGTVTYTNNDHPDLTAPLEAGFYQGADGAVELNGYFAKGDATSGMSGILYTTEKK